MFYFAMLSANSRYYMWWIFFSYILFKRFYFGDKISLNHVADFLQLHPLQKVLFWWQDLSQSSGRFSSATSSSKDSILVKRSLSIMWRIFFIYILFYFGDKITLNHVVDFLQLHLLQKGSILVTRSLSILWRIFFSYILFNRFYFGDKIYLNHVADFLHLHTPQKVLFWWQDLSII